MPRPLNRLKTYADKTGCTYEQLRQHVLEECGDAMKRAIVEHEDEMRDWCYIKHLARTEHKRYIYRKPRNCFAE